MNQTQEKRGAVRGAKKNIDTAIVTSVLEADVTSMLMSEVPTVAKKADGIPNVEHPELNDAINKYLEALIQKDEAEDAIEQYFPIIAPVLEKDRIAKSKDHGYLSSVRVNDSLCYTVSHGYKKIPITKKNDLQSIFGVVYSKYFADEHTVKVKCVNPQMISELKLVAERMGKKFSDLFDVSIEIAPNNTFTQDRVMNDDVSNKFDLAVNKELIDPKKATLK